MSEFSKLLKNSRFASLAKPLGKRKGNSHPTHQVVETRASSLHRQEWGLKYALPKKIKSRYITFNNADTMERIVDFETNGSDHWKRLRFQETGLVPKLDNSKQNPLFGSTSEQNNIVGVNREIENILNLPENLNRKDIQALKLVFKNLRDEFREYVKSQDIILLNKEKFKVDKFEKLARDFLKEYKLKSTVNKIESIETKRDEFKFNGFGGLSYNLKGRLSSTPNGIKDKKIITGRYIGADQQNTLVGIGGFTGVANKVLSKTQIQNIKSQGKELRESIVPFHLTEATIFKSGAVIVDAHLTSSASTSRLPNRSSRTRSNIETKDTDVVLKNLLDLLNSKKKNI
ncbi:hypothetical protein WICMUC_000792 [Wickerhamomyces mucosus]|uniref:Uncharacterized protein n=1 Tax=Wickerhamomyces mucosus TaxID=1378264 RepID=A0A9P8PWA9_9ASCO|nr:hypothetical protein WICMUC_000792 [Wickerhamomyces mucosus]